MTERRVPAEVFPPGVFLEEELEARGLTQTDFAEILGKLPKDVNLLIKGRVSITPETAIALADALGTSDRYWLNLEASYQAHKARQKRTEENPERATEIALKGKLYETYPVRELLKRGWVEGTSDIRELAKRFCSYFNVPDLDTEAECEYAARKSGEYSSHTNLQKAWVLRAKQLARTTMLRNNFSQTKLKSCYAELKLLLHEEEEIRKVPGLLADAGIRFVIVEFLPGSKIDGATCWLDDNSPVVALSLWKDRIDNFWFTLMHELSHVEHGEGKDKDIIDVDLFGEDQPADRPAFEYRADKDAAEFCVPQDALNNFIVRTDPYFHASKILGFALHNKVHPGLVVGQLQKRGKIRWDQHRKFLPKIRNIIKEPSVTDGYGFNVTIKE